MADLWCRVTDCCQSGINYIKELRIAEVRQTLDLVGIYHSQVALAVVLFIMLVFTRFTAVLLVASLIAYIIFYMTAQTQFDSLFPDAKGHDNGNFYSHTINRAANTSQYSSDNNIGSRRSPVGSPNPNLEYNSPTSGRSNQNNVDSNASATRTDARTSAVFPPFGNNDHKGGAVQDKRQRHLERNDSKNEVRYSRRYSRPTTINDERLRRDPLPFRRMITSDYRQFRNQANDVQNSNVNEESNQRYRRSVNNEHKAKKERKTSSEKRRSSSKNVYDQHYERLREMSRDHSNKYSQAGAGPSHRSSALYGRPMASPPSSHKRKGRLGA